MLTIGSPAPAFTLPDQDGTTVALKDLRGRWVVLYFYPKDDTPGCTVEACEFTASLPAFRGLDAEVFGCSADGAAAHTKFVAKYKLGIRLLTDADRSVMKGYGAFGSKLMYGKKVEGVIRSTVLIAPDGTVAHHWPTVKAAGHAEQVRGKLAELQGGGGAAAATSAKKPAAKKPAKAAAKKAAPAAKKPAAKPAKKTAKKAKAAKK
jgi:peroxiredoxin Q/BCP